MRIKEFVIKNFKNIGMGEEFKIVFPPATSANFISLIGENNIGKSSVLEALRLFLPEYVSVPSIEMFPNRKEPQNETEYMEISVLFSDFTEKEKNHQYIKPYVYNGEMLVRRIWKSSKLRDSEAPFEVFIPNMVISELIGKRTWNKKAFMDVSEELQSLYKSYCLEKGMAEGETIKADSQGDFIEYVSLNDDSLLSFSEPQWMPNPNGFSSKLRSVMPKVIYVPAVKVINDEADASKSKSAVNSIVSALFEMHLNNLEEIQSFNESIRSIRNLFDPNNKHPEILGLQGRLNQKVQRVMDIEVELEFGTPEVMEKLHLNTNVLLRNGNLSTEPEHQGNGAQRTLILSLLEMMAEYVSDEKKVDKNLLQYDQSNQMDIKRRFLFLIEEPEIYLHPHLQKKMRDALVSLSKDHSSQVICTSHSEQFIDLADRHQGIVLVKKNEHGQARHLQVSKDIYEGDKKRDKRDRMRMLLNFTPSTLEAFFAERVVLVEGDCEVAAIETIKGKLIELGRVDANKINKCLKSITVIPCNGKLTQLAFYEVLSHFGVETFLIHDLDSQELDEGNNQIILDAIKDEKYRLTHEPNFEGFIFNDTWNNDKPWKAVKFISEKFTDYEPELLRFFKFVIGDHNYKDLGIEKELNVK